MATDNSTLIEQLLPDNAAELIKPAHVRAVAHALDQQVPNQRRGGPFLVAYLTRKAAQDDQNGSLSSLDQINPALLCIGSRARVDRYPGGSQWLELVFDDRTDILGGLRAYFEGTFAEFPGQPQGLVPVRWAVAGSLDALTANVPAYSATKVYPVGYLVRYAPLNSPESFFVALKAGKLPAPTGALTDQSWKLVPGPVQATALSQELTLDQAQAIEGDQVVAGRDYLIKWATDAAGYVQTITVRGVSNNSFDVEGTLEVNGQRSVVSVNVATGTFSPRQLGGAASPPLTAQYWQPGSIGGKEAFVLSPESERQQEQLRLLHLHASAAVLPTLPVLPVPADAPVGIAAPGEAFPLTAAAATGVGVSEIAEYDRAAGAGQTMQLSGEQLTSLAAVVWANGKLLEAKASAGTRQLATVQLPTNSGAWGAFVLWLKNEQGYGAPVLLNRTRALWMSTTVTPGITGHIFGRNLAHGNVRGGACYVYLVHKTSGVVTPCQVVGTTIGERVSFAVPAGLALGEYWVWAHNGHGGAWGWSERLSCTVIANADHVLTHQWAPPAAVTNGGGDMAAAIRQATQANNGTNTPTLLGAGTWQLGSGLPIQDRYYLLGEVGSNGVPTTVLRPLASFDKDAQGCGLIGALPYAPTTALVRLENFLIDNSAGIDVGQALLNLRSISQFWGRNVWLRQPGGALIRLSDNTHGVWLDDCDLVGGSFNQTPFVCASAPDAQIYLARTAFRLTQNADAALNLKGVSHVALLAGCSCNNLDSSKLDGATNGQGRYLKGSGQGGAGNEGWHVEANTGTDQGPVLGAGATNPSTNDNTGEFIMSEAGATSFSDVIASADANSLTFASAPSLDQNGGAAPGVHYAHVVAGRGLGQLLKVTANNGAGKITLEQPWRVVPDTTSVVMVGPFSRWVHVVDCVVSARAGMNGSTYSASAFFEPYGGCHQWYAARNRATGFRNGVANIATQHNARFLDANSFIEAIDNQFINCSWAQRTEASGEGSGIPSGQGYPGHGIIAARYRNTCTGSTVADAVYALPRPDNPDTAPNFKLPVVAGMLYEKAPATVPINDYKVIFGQRPQEVAAGQLVAVAVPGPAEEGASVGEEGSRTSKFDIEVLPADADIDRDRILTFSTPSYSPWILGYLSASGFVPLALVPTSGGDSYTDAQARAAQLGRTAAAGTTTVTLTSESATDYGTAASGTFTVDLAGCVVGKVVRFALGAGATAPMFGAAPAGRPYKYLGVSYASGKAFSYSLLVCVDRIEVVILAE